MFVQSLILGLAALAAAVPTNCPTEVVSTVNAGREWTTTAIATSTTTGTTYTMTVPTYTSTKTVTRGTTTKYVTKSTGTEPVVKTETSIKCTDHATKNVEFTTTVYTGSFTPSSLRQSCLPNTRTTYVYDKTKTVTTTATDGVRITTSTPAVKTKTKYPNTVTSTMYEYGLPQSATSTSTVTAKGWCTKTVTTGTAKATATYAAKCKPSNLIDGSAPVNFADNQPANNPGDHANKDASACCQSCVDKEDCAASWLTHYMGEDTCITYGRGQWKPTCDVAYAVRVPNNMEEDSGRRGSVGCGSIVQKIGW